MTRGSPTFIRLFHSRAAEIAEAADAMRDWGQANGFQTRTINCIGVVLDELLANIASHAYGGREDGRIEVGAAFDGSSVSVTVRDYGPAFDPTQAAPVNTEQTIDERDFGGLGLLILNRFADTVSYRRDGDANAVVFGKTDRSNDE